MKLRDLNDEEMEIVNDYTADSILDAIEEEKEEDGNSIVTNIVLDYARRLTLEEKLAYLTENDDIDELESVFGFKLTKKERDNA